MPYSIRPRHPNPNGDSRCPDGFACYGWRKIHKGGYVRWYGIKYQHPQLAEWVGLWVYVTIADWLASELEIWTGKPWEGENLIAEAVENRA
jgi:hypothetical protein